MQFRYKANDIRIIDREGEPWWVAVDACGTIGTETRDLRKVLDDDEVDTIHITDAAGRQQEMLVISESGLYSLILRSRKPEAKPFRRWVTHEVLPSIRRTGSYAAPAATNRIGHDDAQAIAAEVVSMLAANRAGIADLIATARMPQQGEPIPEGLRVYISAFCRGRLILEGYGFTRAKLRTFVDDVRIVLEAMEYVGTTEIVDNRQGTDPIARKSEAPFGMWHVRREHLSLLEEAYRRVLSATPGMKRGGDGQKFLPFDGK